MKEYFVGILCLCSLCVNAQTIIDYPHQKYRIGDEVVGKQLVNRSSIWDLEGTKVINDHHSVSYFDFEPEIITCIENDGRIYYEQNESGISIAGYENPLSKVDFTLKEKWLPFPFSVGNHTSGYFCGKGKYCDKLFIREFGTYNTQADSVGTVILPNGDSIPNVLCVHSIRLKSFVSAPIDTLNKVIPEFTEDSIRVYLSKNSYMVKDEEYRLYAVGTRYPIVSKKIEKDYSSGKIISECLYYYSPEEQASTLPLDEANYVSRVLERNSYDSESEQKSDGHTKMKAVKVQYNSDSKQLFILHGINSNMSKKIILADGNGIVYDIESFITGTEADSIKIDCSRMPSGKYIIYYEVDKQKHAEKFMIE